MTAAVSRPEGYTDRFGRGCRILRSYVYLFGRAAVVRAVVYTVAAGAIYTVVFVFF